MSTFVVSCSTILTSLEVGRSSVVLELPWSTMEFLFVE